MSKSKLISIEIKGFKSFDSVGQKIFLEDLTVMIGANGSGKSNFISLIKMISFMLANRLQYYIQRNGGAESILHFGSKKTNQIECELVFSIESSVDKYSFVLSYAPTDILFFENEKLSWQGNFTREEFELNSDRGKKETYLNSNENIFHKNKYISKTVSVLRDLLKNIQIYQFHDTSLEARIRGLNRIDDTLFLRNDGGNLAAILYGLANSKLYRAYYDRIVEHIQFVFPEFQDFVLVPEKIAENSIALRWISKNSEYVLGPHQLSDGSLRFIALTTLLLLPKDLHPAVIILDEPELGLHPRAISVLAGMVNSLKSDTQLIIATQSVNLLDEIEISDVVVVEKNAKTNSTEFKKPDINSLKEWLDEYSVGELWLKNVLGGRP
ncbi:MAG: AAA family ATPase [Ignavibacteriales bacterium]|jgi:Predicted ATPase|nr:MAG: AAA family ATPase [Ignavibacteriaceae bacterium]MBW7873288.1 AAA family ATPase [Ignavibacteria bacterium]MCZ2143025.1 AAA family ATPase [Ignavibacteriales bacterium]OQY77634.1 MAG: hypothetical protein B6D45_02455 [Ignavibacteriales bacterium UTCHB3]MBV6444716.1 hypothetical protein [Ignavibacteriaceae bacterium]